MLIRGAMWRIFQGFTQFGAGDQNHFGLEVAGDFGVQAWSKRMAGVGMQTFGYQHISAIGSAAPKDRALVVRFQFHAVQRGVADASDP
ncbi:MAG: hypothetical protein IPI57_09370 [Candidatus Competibacteraceae bacterium]|nr:hypothetical protein [Candidatus Competibacteraceae bacterium]